MTAAVIVVIGLQTVCITALVAMLVYSIAQVFRVNEQLTKIQTGAADARADAEQKRATVAEAQTKAATDAAADERATFERVVETAAAHGGVVDAGVLWDAGVHDDEDRPRPGSDSGGVSDRRPATSPGLGPATSRRLPR